MANQTISTSTNHDALTGRLAGEDITINSGAKLTIDSMPHLTSMGILGDIRINDGEVHIDGTRTYEITYSGGSGTLLAVGDGGSFGPGGVYLFKVVRLNSGDAAAGVMTITVDALTGGVPSSGTITGGSWSATISSAKVGFLIIYGEDQVWDAVDARATLRITGDWYEIYTGDGTDSQTITLPHGGWQWGVWVETAAGSGVYQPWCRINGVASAVFYNSVSQFGTDWESSGVYTQSGSVLTFGTAAAGGVIPNGARVRIPNVHISTTTTAAPTTEIRTITLANYLEIIDGSVSENVFIDHLNAGGCQLSLVQTNGATISDSCWGMYNATNYINKCNKPVTITNCVMSGGTGLTDEPPLVRPIIKDNTGGITFEDCVFYGGTNASASAALTIVTAANIDFIGTNKFIAGEQDENTFGALRLTTASNIAAETLIMLGGGILTSAGCSNIDIDEIAYGQPPGRGTTENTLNPVNLAATFNSIIRSGRLITNASPMRGTQIAVADCDGITVRNFGAPDAKINNGGFGSAGINVAGISTNCLFQRICFTGLATATATSTVNSCANITFENCTSDYDDEIDPKANNCIIKGHHGASGIVGATTGVEDDYINVIGSVFMDYFKSDTTGAVGLVFNDPGDTYGPYFTLVSGTPLFNALGDLLMRTSGDQVIYEWPYWIKGHTAFQNAAIEKIGNNQANITAEYDLDTGSGYSGTWKSATGANLSGETISPSGFKVKIRLTATATNASQDIRGIALLTTTTIADQVANLYPLDTTLLTLTGLVAGSEVRCYTGTDPASVVEIGGTESSGTSFELSHTSGDVDGYIVVFALGYLPVRIALTYPAEDSSIPIQQVVDRVYANN